MEKVYIIILNYNGKDDTVQCVRSLQGVEFKNYEVSILIVDNASTDGSEDYFKGIFGETVEILQTNKNLGYAGGNNIGIRYAIAHGAQYICVMNNDIIVKEDVFSECINELVKDPKTAFVAPGVANYYSDLSDNTGGNISIIKGKVVFLNEYKTRQEIDKKSIVCDMVEGSCFLFRTGIIEDVGFLPESYFMYYEETEWCYRAKKKGYHCISVPAKWVYHKKRVAAKKNKGFFKYMMERNRVVFVKRNATAIEKMIFFPYLLIRTICYSRSEKIPYVKLLQAQLDGMFNRISKMYPFIYIPVE